MAAAKKTWVFPLLIGLVIFAVLLYVAYFNKPIIKATPELKQKIRNANVGSWPYPNGVVDGGVADEVWMGTGAYLTNLCNGSPVGCPADNAEISAKAGFAMSFFKGMDIEPGLWNVNLFRNDIASYMQNGGTNDVDSVKIGEYL